MSDMTDDPTPTLLSAADRAVARRLVDEIDRFNLETRGIRDVHELLEVETDRDGELAAGLYGWTWSGTCWIDALWVRADLRRRHLGSRLVDAAEADARREENSGLLESREPR